MVGLVRFFRATRAASAAASRQSEPRDKRGEPRVPRKNQRCDTFGTLDLVSKISRFSSFLSTVCLLSICPFFDWSDEEVRRILIRWRILCRVKGHFLPARSSFLARSTAVLRGTNDSPMVIPFLRDPRGVTFSSGSR